MKEGEHEVSPLDKARNVRAARGGEPGQKGAEDSTIDISSN